MKYPALRLRAKCERRLLQGHLWIYSNEVDIATTPLKELSPGQPVVVETAQGKPLGVATVSPSNLICARLLSRSPGCVLDAAFFRQRIAAALQLREQMFTRPFYRLVYGEADQLPGLIVDRFGDVLVVQLATCGMELFREDIIASLQDLLQPTGILLKNDSGAREAEGLPAYVEVASGQVPEQVWLEENGVQFEVSVFSGQKTGWFYDHRDSRAALARYCGGARVLDVFSYVGGWGVQAAVAGAAHVLCIDSSADALALARRNAEINNCAAQLETLQGQAALRLQELATAGRQFDIVVLDPPAFIKRRKDAGPGQAAYRKINQLALQVLAPGGLLVTASCSMHLSRPELVALLAAAAARSERGCVIVEQGGQGRDHPVVPVIPETEYLKTLFARLTGAAK